MSVKKSPLRVHRSLVYVNRSLLRVNRSFLCVGRSFLCIKRVLLCNALDTRTSFYFLSFFLSFFPSRRTICINKEEGWKEGGRGSQERG